MVVELVRYHIRAYFRRCYISASRHPLLVFMIIVLIWTYQSFPLLFSLLVHASPVIVSTLVLLGTLLFYGHANAPKIETLKEEKSHSHYDQNNIVFRGIPGNSNTEIEEDCRSRSSIGSYVSRGKLRSRDVSRRSSFDPLGHMDDYDNKGWESGSDVDVLPMFDELHHPVLEGGEIGVETDDDEDGDDGHEEESGMIWTEDVHRNILNSGTLEFERNQRMESLIARQKAIKNMRMQAEKNMVNMSHDVHFMDTHISTSRNNPFDLPNMMPRRKSMDFCYDLLDRPRPSFQSDSGALQTNHSTFGPHSVPKRTASDTVSAVAAHASDINEYLTPRNRDTVKFHQAAEGNDRSNEVKTSGENSGNEHKTFDKSNSSAFFDVPDDIFDGDGDGDGGNDNAKEEYGSVDNSSSDSTDQEEDSEDSDTEEVGLAERIRSWLIGW